jgi:hypothetical protein
VPQEHSCGASVAPVQFLLCLAIHNHVSNDANYKPAQEDDIGALEGIEKIDLKYIECLVVKIGVLNSKKNR